MKESHYLQFQFTAFLHLSLSLPPLLPFHRFHSECTEPAMRLLEWGEEPEVSCSPVSSFRRPAGTQTTLTAGRPQKLLQLLPKVPLLQLPVIVSSLSTFLTHRTELIFCKTCLWSTWALLLPNNSLSGNSSWLCPLQECDSGGRSFRQLTPHRYSIKKSHVFQDRMSLKVNPFKCLQQQHQSSHVSMNVHGDLLIYVVPVQFGNIKKSRWRPDVVYKIVIVRMKTVNICTFVLT